MGYQGTLRAAFNERDKRLHVGIHAGCEFVDSTAIDTTTQVLHVSRLVDANLRRNAL
jgi:hypothetical protein